MVILKVIAAVLITVIAIAIASVIVIMIRIIESSDYSNNTINI